MLHAASYGSVNGLMTNLCKWRRAAALAHSVVHTKAIRLLREAIAKIPKVLADPAPDVGPLEFNLAGPVLAVRPYCNDNHYRQVFSTATAHFA
jgi:small-conductance mechanosensitive channel